MPALITDGTIKIGVNDAGNLIVPDPTSKTTSNGIGLATGLQYVPTGNDFAAPVYPGEGWGVASLATRALGWANQVNLVQDDGTTPLAQAMAAYTDLLTVQTTSVGTGNSGLVVHVGLG